MKIYKAKGQGIFVNNILRIDTINSLDNDILLVKYKDGNEVVIDDYNIIADTKAKMEKVSDVVANLPKASDRIKDNLTFNDIQIGDIIEIDGDAVIVDENILNMINATNKLDILGDGSCIACYPFDGNVNDLSNNHNGKIIDIDGNESNLNYGDGKFNNAIIVKDNVGIEYMLVKAEEDYALSGWFKIVSDPNNSDPIHFFQNGICNDAYTTINLHYSDNKIISKTHMDNTDSGSDIIGEGNYELNSDIFNQWIHIIQVKKDLNISVYLNGNKIISYDLSQQPGETRRTLRTGASYQNVYGCDTDFSGLEIWVDQVRIFNKALTDEEVKKVYQETSKLIKKII
jgi:hypothetical protein